MGKLGLQKVDKGTALPQAQPNLPIQKDQTPQTSDTTQVSWQQTAGQIAIEHASELISLVGDIIHGGLDIAKLNAQTDNQIRLIAAEVDKIWKEANAKINVMEAEGREWEKKFDKKKELLLEIINRINVSPQMGKEERIALINAVTVAINQP